MLGNIGIILFVLSLCMMPVAWLVVGLSFDKKYKNLNNPLARLGPLSRLGRALQYVRLIVLGTKLQNVYWRTVFGGHNLKKEASVFQAVVAYIMFLSFTLGCLLLLVAALLHSVGK